MIWKKAVQFFYLTFHLEFVALDLIQRTNFRGNEVRLQPLGTEGQGMPGFDSKYNLMSAGLSLGGGAKIKISETINIGFESSLRRTLTDYLDDLSGNYVNYDDLSAGNGVLAASLGNRMNEYLGQSEPSTGPDRFHSGWCKSKGQSHLPEILAIFSTRFKEKA
jgi:hypothetical protein